MVDTIVVLEGEVAELYTKVKNSSVGISKLRCNKKALATLVGLGLFKVQPGINGRPDRVKLSDKAKTTDIRVC